jgi:norsolorinic acid ketoreductase
LHDLPHGEDSKEILLKIDSASETDVLAAVNILTSEHGITKLDIVIANAGISNYFGKALITPVEQMLEHFKINSLAPLLLFQATAPLLNAAINAKFVTVTSGAGSISGMDKLQVENTAYGASKAALNFITRKIHFENPNLIAFPINPGWLQTEAGNPNHRYSDAESNFSPSWVIMQLPAPECLRLLWRCRTVLMV